MLLENGADKLARHRVATDLHFVKNIVSVKHNRAKTKEVGYVSTSRIMLPGQRGAKCLSTGSQFSLRL